MEEYNAIQYPEGVEKVKEEFLTFLPEDDDVRNEFMDSLLQFIVMF